MAKPSASPALRVILVLSGLAFVGIGMLGVVLPLLPTTPFLLLAAACFAKSSPALHQRMLRNRVIGPIILEWQQSRTIPPPAKKKAILLLAASIALSICLAGSTALRIFLVLLGIVLVSFLASLPTRKEGENQGNSGVGTAAGSASCAEGRDIR
jgi:uncharacterized protein